MSAFSPFEKLRPRLERLRKSGDGWTALCPAHKDRSPSLSVKEVDGGRVLIHCFGGCTPAAVLDALGMGMADLFPERLNPESPEERRQWARQARLSQVGAAANVLATECVVVANAARQVMGGGSLTPDDFTRLTLAYERIEGARGVLNG